MKSSRWTIVLGVIAFLVLVSMVWASPPPDVPLVPPQASPGFDADMVDGHHAGASSGALSQRQNRVLWAQSNGKFPVKALPMPQLNNRYLNDDRQETISAAVAGSLLTVNNTGNGRGVTGQSANDFGVHAWGNNASSTDRFGDLLLEGTRGEITTFGTVLNLLSDGNVQIYLDDNNNDSSSWFGIWNGADNNVFRVYENGNTWAAGTKGAMVQTEDHGLRTLYAMESPEVWLEDFGSASLDQGLAIVRIEPIFAETVNLEIDYHVFLTPLGECNGLYVAAKSSTSFEVRELDGGTSNIEFDYRMVAKRLGYEDVRMERVAADTLAEE